MHKRLIKLSKYLFRMLSFLPQVENWWDVLILFLFPQEMVLKLRDGTRFVVKHFLDAYTIKEVYINQEYVIKLRKPLVIIDIGANIGTFSIFASKMYPKAKIYSYEPAKETFKILTNNLKLNKSRNVTACNLGVADTVSQRTFYNQQASGLSGLYIKRAGGTKEKVRLITLKKIFVNNKIKDCDFIKMDCEGSEYEILFSTPKSLFKKIKCLSIEYHLGIHGYTKNALVRHLRKVGYRVRVLKNPIEEDIGIIYANR